MLAIRTAALALLVITLLAPGTASAAETVVLMDAATPLPADGSVQQRTLGAKSVWIPGPGADPPSGGTVLTAADDETLYLVRDHGVDEAGRLLASWDGYRIVAVRTQDATARFHHCRERLRWLPPAPRPAEPSVALARRATPEEKASLVDAVDLGLYTETLRRLSGDLDTDGNGSTVATRWTYSDGQPSGIDLARAYLIGRLEDLGYTVIEQEFAMPSPGRTARNLIAIREGAVSPDEVVVVGAHYDSVSEIASTSAPGAEDNGSGTAAVIELARVFANVTPERSIHFVCFGGEEQGLYGSQHYVSQLGANGWTVVGAYTMDMVAAWTDDFGVLIEGNTASQSLMELLNTNVVAQGQISSAYSFNPFGSDHIPFLQAGIPALLAIDLDWAAYTPYHRSTDTFDKTDPTLGHRIAQAIAGAVVDLAGTVQVVGVDDDETPPVGRDAVLALADPFPNPFNPRTVIDFTIPREGQASVRIYDARGRVVRRLVDGTRPAGRATVVWDGQDEDGRAVASGLYFVRLEHEDGVVTRRAVLVR